MSDALLSLPYHCKALLAAKQESDITFAEIAKAIDKPEVWTTALFYGQATTDKTTAGAILEALNAKEIFESLNDAIMEEDTGEDLLIFQRVLKGLSGLGAENLGVKGMITRGALWDGPPQDPVLYRLYEALVVYGMSYKALIQEKFGDGIMSAIDFRTSLERKPDPKGDRVVITMDGKFLPYSDPSVW